MVTARIGSAVQYIAVTLRMFCLCRGMGRTRLSPYFRWISSNEPQPPWRSSELEEMSSEPLEQSPLQVELQLQRQRVLELAKQSRLVRSSTLQSLPLQRR